MTDWRSNSPQKPNWWKRNQRLRDELDLPPYEPSRFEDGAYTHTIIDTLEDNYNCRITFKTKNPNHPSKWNVYINGEEVITMERRRTKQGNTVFKLSSREFKGAVRSHFRDNVE